VDFRRVFPYSVRIFYLSLKSPLFISEEYGHCAVRTECSKANDVLLVLNDHAMAQAVSSRHGFDRISVRVIFVFDEVALGQPCLRVLWFCPVSIFPQMLCTYFQLMLLLSKGQTGLGMHQKNEWSLGNRGALDRKALDSLGSRKKMGSFGGVKLTLNINRRRVLLSLLL